MKKKYRDIVVDDQTYGWQVKFGRNEVRIWKDKKIILEHRVPKDKDYEEPITPKYVESVIREEILNQKPHNEKN